MWLSTRRIRRVGDADWNEYIQFVGLHQLQELRTIDAWCNPCDGGNFPVATIRELWELLATDLIPVPVPEREYHLLFTDALGPNGTIKHPRLKLLGFDLSDETRTSSLLNCGRWQGVLEPIAKRAGMNGLLQFDDAKLAQSLLPEAWNEDPHGYVTIWSLFEVTPSA